MRNPSPPSSSRPRLLVVDDDPLITDTLAFALGDDYDVVTSASRLHALAPKRAVAVPPAPGPGASEQVRPLAAPPPLALVDLGLPPTPHTPDEGFQLVADLLAHS